MDWDRFENLYIKITGNVLLGTLTLLAIIILPLSFIGICFMLFTHLKETVIIVVSLSLFITLTYYIGMFVERKIIGKL